MAETLQGTIKAAADFKAEEDAKALNKAFGEKGCDEQAVINVIVGRSNAQRQEIAKSYKTQFSKDLSDVLKSNTRGCFETLIVSLMVPADQYDAYCLGKAIKGAGTDEACLTEILCSRTNAEIATANKAYKENKKSTLEKDIEGDTSGHYRKLMMSLAQGKRDEEKTTVAAVVKQHAEDLFNAGVGKWGTDEAIFNQIMSTRSWEHLRAVFKVYKNDIVVAIQKEFSGCAEEGYKAIAQVAINKQAYFALRLLKTMKGGGTDEDSLTRLVVSRSEIDLLNIKQQFKKDTGKTLAAVIKDDTSGAYRTCLLKIVGE